MTTADTTTESDKNNKGYEEEEDMMFYANILLQLPQLVALDEARKLSSESLPLSTKKPSIPSPNSLTGFKYCGVSSDKLSCDSRKKHTNVEGALAGKKRKKTNPNPSPNADTTTTVPMEIKEHAPTLFKIRFKCSGFPSGHTNNVADEGKKRKKPNPSSSPKSDTTTAAMKLEPAPKKELKVRFKFTGRSCNRDTGVMANKDSSSSSASSKAESKPSSMVDHKPQSTESEKKKKNNDLGKTRPLIPDLNIPIMEDDFDTTAAV